jgi:UDPglucose 6-dehydrogenase
LGKGKTAVIKSTVLPGTTEKLQEKFPDIFVFHSPEFLAEATAAYDAAYPNRNIVGIPKWNPKYKNRAKAVLAVLPKAPYQAILPVREAELVKYAGNCLLFVKVVFGNLLYDVAKKVGVDWSKVKDAVAADPRIGKSHLEPVHQNGRGAGGHCFIKDFAAFAALYKEAVADGFGVNVLDSLRDKNVDLLLKSAKDLDLLEGVYGDLFLERFKDKNK